MTPIKGVYHSAKIRNFKQITTVQDCCFNVGWVFITLQRYEILSKSQQIKVTKVTLSGVYHSAKIRNFKQITTRYGVFVSYGVVFITLQRYEILSKSQRNLISSLFASRCLSLCKDTKF